MNSLSRHQQLVGALRKTMSGRDRTGDTTVLETHISSVILVGDFAYKIKKPVNFGFVDFSTLEKRLRYCKKEVSLNRRLAPQLYIGVVPVCGTIQHPEIDGDGDVIEYAIKMHRFDQTGLFDQMAAQGALNEPLIVDLATTIADFHVRAQSAPDDNDLGSADRILYWFNENFAQIAPKLQDVADISRLQTIRQWSDKQWNLLHGVLTGRKQHGFIKACHGDLHLGNVVAIDNVPVAFDCIEFNDELRWIDPISEVAFLCMDLDKHRLAKLSKVFLNTYLGCTGDYDGMHLFSYYCVYRALVRAKVSVLKQTAEKDLTEYRRYIDLVQKYIAAPQPTLLITHGVSGSGKSYWSKILATRLGLIHIRSDVERKRLAGLQARESSQSQLGTGLYTEDISRLTYQHLEHIAQTLLNVGQSLIIDATFLQSQQRSRFRSLARRLDTKFYVLAFRASATTLHERVERRKKQRSDPSEADTSVLEHQLAQQQPLAEKEMSDVIECDSESTIAMEAVIESLGEVNQETLA